MRRTIDITYEVVIDILDYNPKTGKFTWKVRPRKYFTSDYYCSLWNNRYAGTVAGLSNSSNYNKIMFGGKYYSAHRLAWLYVHGVWPKDQIDHINGNKLDNRISNLRDVIRTTNLQNKKKAHKNNLSSGLLGVSLFKQTGRWNAKIGHKGKKYHLGFFDTPEEAHEAYLEAKSKYHSAGYVPQKTGDGNGR